MTIIDRRKAVSFHYPDLQHDNGEGGDFRVQNREDNGDEEFYWYSKEINEPTDAEMLEWTKEAEDPLIPLREKRNSLLASSDWTGLSDLALTNENSAEWKLYRQKLRNLPDGLDTDDKVNAVTWPTKPE